MDRVTLATTAPGVYAGGDVAFGPRNLIEAIANGKRAARSIHEHLAREAVRLESVIAVEKIPTRDYRMIAGFELVDREAPPTARPRAAERDRGGGGGLPRGGGHRAGRALPGLPRADHLRPGEVRPVRPLRGRVPEYCLALVPLEDVELPEGSGARSPTPPRGAPCRSPP